MLERFTDRARRVIVLAQEEARRLDHAYIGTEHILLGLVGEGEGVATQALVSSGVSVEAVRRQVESIIGRGPEPPTGDIPFTPRAKKVLELSLREAHQLGHHHIDTEHILFGLLREGQGVAAQVLQGLGGDLSRVRRQLVRLLTGSPTTEAVTRPVPVLERLTEEALTGLVAARGLSQRLGLESVEAGALFVGLLSVGEGSAARVLTSVVPVDRLEVALGDLTDEAVSSDAPPLPLSESARRLLALVAANVTGAIGTGHIAAALLMDDAVAALLRAADGSVTKARHESRRLHEAGGLP